MYSKTTSGIPTTVYQNSLAHPHRRRRGRPTLQAALTFRKCVKEYFENTLLHGYRYVTEANRCTYERILWLLVLVFMICGVTYVITDYYLRFLNAPTATSQQAIRVPISEIAFPSVVICPGTRINKTAVGELAQEM